MMLAGFVRARFFADRIARFDLPLPDRYIPRGPVARRSAQMTNSASGSITQWIGELRSGEADAASKLWARYFDDLVRLASSQLRGAPCAMADEEDVALSVLDTVCRGVAAGRLTSVHDRHDLWRLLVVIARQKSIDYRRLQGRKKRGGGMIVYLETPADTDSSKVSWLEILEGGPHPDDIAVLKEQLALSLADLPDDTFRKVAIAKLEGYTNQEIARQLQVAERTVERKLQLVKNLWLQRLAS
jgi:DNA-directed RNA polymerase specialized sigma24 family protein